MHIVLDFFIGLPIFVFLVVALVTTGGLACTIVLAVPALWLTLVFVRLLGMFERARFCVLLDVALPDPYPPFVGVVPLPVKYRLHFGEPMTFTGDPDDDDEVMGDKVTAVKRRLESMIHLGLQERKHVFW